MTKLTKFIHFRGATLSTLAALLVAAATAPGHAQPAFDDAARRAVVAGAAEALRTRYVFPDVGERAAAAIESALAEGKYDDVAEARAFAQWLTADLQAVARDKHLRVNAFGPPAPAPGGGAPQAPPRNDAGVGRADRLADNVGYLEELVAFPPLDAFQPPFDRAMAALKDTRALIIDARRHGGGTPTSETYLASYLLEAGKRVEVNRFIWRNPGTDTFRTENFWSSPTPSPTPANRSTCSRAASPSRAARRWPTTCAPSGSRASSARRPAAAHIRAAWSPSARGSRCSCRRAAARTRPPVRTGKASASLPTLPFPPRTR